MKIVVNLWLSSVANSYIQPSLESQFLQYTSLLQNKILGHMPLDHITSPNHMPSSEHHPILHFTVLEVDHLVEQEGAPGGSSEPWVNIMMVRSVLQWLAVLWMSHLVEMSSSLLVRTVSHEAQENRRVPPMCWIKIRPIFTSDKRNHTNIRIGIQSQLDDCRRVLLPPLKREQVRHTIFIKSLNIRYTALLRW